MRELETEEVILVSGGYFGEELLQAITSAIIALGGGGPTVITAPENTSSGLRG